MHQADSVLNILESEDDWIDRPLGPQRIVEQHCAPDHRGGDFGQVTRREGRATEGLCCCGPSKRRLAAGVAFRPHTLV